MDALSRFLEHVGRLRDEANELRAEELRILEQLQHLETRRDQIMRRMRTIDEQSKHLAQQHSKTVTPPSPAQIGIPLQDVKPVIVLDEDDAADVTDRRRRSETAAEGLSQQRLPLLPTPANEPDGVTSEAAPEDERHIIHASYPSVIFLNGHWTETSCGDCGANANKKRQKFFNGTSGLHAHAKQVHGVLPLDNVMQRSTKRLVDLADVALMLKGAGPSQVALTQNYGRTTTTEGTTSLPKTSKTRSPAMAARASLTEYETFQNIEAQAKASGTPQPKRQKRASTGQPSYAAYIEDDDNEEENLPHRKGAPSKRTDSVHDEEVYSPHRPSPSCAWW